MLPFQPTFISANYVAREVDYDMDDWNVGDAATNAAFAPIDRFEAQFAEVLDDTVALGFDRLDIWTAHLNWRWSTDEHVAIARRLLDERGLTVTTYAGDYGSTPQEFAMACELAATLGIPIIAGNPRDALLADRAHCAATLERLDLRLALENHPERSVAEALEQIGDGANGRIGACPDTGWYATQRVDTAAAIRELAPHLVHVHLKDVLAHDAHDCATYGEGVANVRDCVFALVEIGYVGSVSIEVEPFDFHPDEAVRTSRERMEAWALEAVEARGAATATATASNGASA